MKLTKLLGILLLLFVLTSCEGEEPEGNTDITLTLVGDSTVRIEEGSEYEDMGIMVNGEVVDFIGYYSTINMNKPGTYYVKYEYEGEEVIRTVEVLPGPRSELLAIIETFEELTNYSYTLDLDVRFERGDTEFHTFIYEDYDVNGNYLYGTVNRTTFQMNEYTQSAYIYLDIANNNEEHYMFDEYSFWYQDIQHIPRATTLFTDFSFDGIKTVTREADGDETIYTGFLNFEDYIVAYNSKINMVPDERFEFEVVDYIEVTIRVKDGYIISFETDLLDVMMGALNEGSNATITEYTYKYTFANFNEVEEIVIPEEGVAAKRLVYPDYTGSGTIDDPFVIMDKTQLITVHDNLDKHFVLGADIDLSGNAWMPLGYTNIYFGESPCFSGTFDGNGYTITNMGVHSELNMEQYGFFYCLDGGTIEDLTLDNVDIYLHDTNSSFTAGVLVGEIITGTVNNVTINGSFHVKITIDDGFHLLTIGGLVGEIKDGATLGGNTYDIDITLETNLPDTNYFIHEIVGKGQEYLTTYTSTSTVTVTVIE